MVVIKSNLIFGPIDVFYGVLFFISTMILKVIHWILSSLGILARLKITIDRFLKILKAINE